jgi:hypothetical protein
MSDKRNVRLVNSEPLGRNDEGEVMIETEIAYWKDARVRGYYLLMHRCTLKGEDGARFKSFVLHRDTVPSRLLLAAPRFNQRHFDALTPDPTALAEMRATLLAQT